MRESGCIYHYESVMLADAKAKTVTSLLPQLTVLAVRACFYQVIENLSFITKFKSLWDGLVDSFVAFGLSQVFGWTDNLENNIMF